MATDPGAGPIREDFTLTDGEGLIDVRGDGGDECGLLIEDRPLAITWPDNLGSIGQYFVRSRDREGISERLRAIRQVALDGINPEVSLAEQIAPLLKLFASGTYRLFYLLWPPGQYQVIWDTDDWSGKKGWNIYPDPIAFLPTQPTKRLQQERIDYFEARLRLQCRPVVFTTGVHEGAWCQFVLDGHHKLRAYEKLRIGPAVLMIVRDAAPPLTTEDGLQYLQHLRVRLNFSPKIVTYQQEYERFKRGG